MGYLIVNISLFSCADSESLSFSSTANIILKVKVSCTVSAEYAKFSMEGYFNFIFCLEFINQLIVSSDRGNTLSLYNGLNSILFLWVDTQYLIPLYL